MKELPQKEEASSVRERLGETLWQFDLWSTYRVIALPIVEIEEKEREELREVEGGRKRGYSRRIDKRARVFYFLFLSRLLFDHYPSTLYTLYENNFLKIIFYILKLPICKSEEASFQRERPLDKRKFSFYKDNREKLV